MKSSGQTYTNNELVSEVHAELESVRERLHVVDEVKSCMLALTPSWQSGETPTERWKARVFGLPLIRQLCGLSPNLFAAALYKWNRSKNHW